MNDTMSETTRNSDIPRAARSVRPKRRDPAPLCVAVNKTNGQPCTMRSLPNDTRCFAHSDRPETIAQRDAARRQGGLTALAKRGAPIDLPSAAFTSRESVREYLEQLADAVVRGAITAAQSNAIANLAGVVLRIDELALSAKIAGLEERLAAEDRRGALAPRIVVKRADEQLGDEHGE